MGGVLLFAIMLFSCKNNSEVQVAPVRHEAATEHPMAPEEACIKRGEDFSWHEKACVRVFRKIWTEQECRELEKGVIWKDDVCFLPQKTQ